MNANQSSTQTNQEPFRCAMFSLFPETIRNMALLSDEQLGEITRALFTHYWEPDAEYTGQDPTLMILYNFASNEMDRYREKCRKNSKNGSQPKSSAKEAKAERTEAKRERIVTQDQDQDQGQDQGQSQGQSPDTDTDRNRKLPALRAQGVEEEFERIWEKYPNKQGKDTAFLAYEKARASGTTQQEVQAGLQRFLAFMAAGSHTEALKGSTWFNFQCWKKENEMIYKKIAPSAQRAASED